MPSESSAQVSVALTGARIKGRHPGYRVSALLSWAAVEILPMPVDATTVHLLRTAVTTQAAQNLVLDLTDVSFLASAGVQLLHELVARDGLRLVAPTTSTAHRTLGLVALDALVTGADPSGSEG